MDGSLKKVEEGLRVAGGACGQRELTEVASVAEL